MSVLPGGYDGGVSLFMRLPAEPLSAREARRAVTTWARSRGVDDLVDDLELVTSELVANAAAHGAGPVTVEAIDAGDSIRLRVTDCGQRTPEQASPTADDISGRGLLIVAALAATWGSRVGDGTTQVWAELMIARR